MADNSCQPLHGMGPLVGDGEVPELSDANRFLSAAFSGLPVPCFELFEFASQVLWQLLIDRLHQFFDGVGGEAGHSRGQGPWCTGCSHMAWPDGRTVCRTFCFPSKNRKSGE